MINRFLIRILTAFFLITTTAFSQEEWGKEKEVMSEFITETIKLDVATIDSLLEQSLNLNDCVAIALRNNIQLQIDRMEYNRVYQSKQGTRQSFFPDLSLNIEREQTTQFDTLDVMSDKTTNEKIDISLTEKVPLGGSLVFTRQLTRTTNQTDRLEDNPTNLWTITFTQPILKGFGFNIGYSDVKLADLDVKIEQYRLHDAILGTIFQVKEALFEVLRQKKLLVATEAAIERSLKLKDVSLAKVDAKIATRRDVLSAEIILQQDYGEKINAQREFDNALDVLKNVMGVDIQRDISLAIDTLSFIPVELKEEEWISIAMNNNTTIKLQEMILEKGKFQTKLARNNTLPDLSLEGVISRRSDDDIFRETRQNDIVGRIKLSYPLPNFSNRAEHQRAKLAERQSERSLEDTRRNILLSVRASTRNLRNGEERLKILQKNISAAREKITFATTMFNLGRASNLDITDAQKDLLEAEVDYAQELSDYYVVQALLESLLGGHPIIHQNN